MVSMTRRQFGTAGAAAGLIGMMGWSGLVAAADTTADPLRFVAPELRASAAILLEQARSRPPLTAAGLGDGRRRSAGSAPAPLAAPRWTKRTIPSAAGNPDVVVYVINARAGAGRPGILHTHGGGYIGGSAAASIHDLQDVAAALDCAIVTVEYRLAPETTFRGSVEDNYAGLKWLHANAAELGVDPARIAVMGESAGGGHAALLAIAARDRGEVPLAFQCLIYPMLDDRTASTRPVPFPIGTLVWTPEANRFGWRSFLGTAPGTPGVPAAGVPARVKSVAGLPPTFIGTGSIDLFVDEDIAYARRLIAQGIPTELVVVPGAFHAFDVIARDTTVAKRFTATRLAALGRALGATPG